MAPRVGLDEWGKSCPPAGIRSADRPACSESLCRLSCACPHQILMFSWRYNPLWLYFHSPAEAFSLLVFEVSKSHKTTRHSQWDSSGRVINPSQRPLPDNTQHSQQTNIHAAGGIRTHDRSRRAAVGATGTGHQVLIICVFYGKNPDFWMSLLKDSPWDASGLHVVGQCDVITPHVELPLAKTQDSTQNIAGVDADSHIHIEPSAFTDIPDKNKQEIQITS